MGTNRARRTHAPAPSDLAGTAASLYITDTLYNLLVNLRASVLISDRLDATFFALSDGTRRAILARLAGGEATVTELSDSFSISQPAVSKHLKVLERAGLVAVGRDAQRRPRRLVVDRLDEATGWIERYRDAWEQNFRRLDALLEEMRDENPTS